MKGNILLYFLVEGPFLVINRMTTLQFNAQIASTFSSLKLLSMQVGGGGNENAKLLVVRSSLSE